MENKDHFHRLQILVTIEQHEWLRKEAFEKRISMGDLIRDLLDRAMKEQTRGDAQK